MSPDNRGCPFACWEGCSFKSRALESPGEGLRDEAAGGARIYLIPSLWWHSSRNQPKTIGNNLLYIHGKKNETQFSNSDWGVKASIEVLTDPDCPPLHNIWKQVWSNVNNLPSLVGRIWHFTKTVNKKPTQSSCCSLHAAILNHYLIGVLDLAL